MAKEAKRLIEALINKDRIESYLANLEKLKAEGSITEEQYTATSDEYYERLGLATSEVLRIKNDLRKELEVVKQELATSKGELATYATRHKVGELSLKQYQVSEKKLGIKIEKLQQDAGELTALVKANTIAELGVTPEAAGATAAKTSQPAAAEISARSKVLAREKKTLQKEPNKAKARELPKPVGTSLAVEDFWKSWDRLLMASCGVFLLVSVFLPWITASEKLGAQYGSASGLDINIIMGIVILIGGLIAAVTAILFAQKVNRIVQIVVGCIALGAVALIIVTGRLPLLSELGRTLIVVSAGFYICIITSGILLATGIFVKK